MAIGLSKDRAEVIWLAVDFADRLREGDGVGSVLGVTVERVTRVAGVRAHEDATDEFPVQTQVDGTQVQVRLGDGGEEGQPAGDYRLNVEVATTQGEELMGRAPLSVAG